MENIQFNVSLDGLSYKCNAIPANQNPVSEYILYVEALENVYEINLALDIYEHNFIIHNYNNIIPPEIMELEFKLGQVLYHRYIAEISTNVEHIGQLS
ncbi:MAG: hypothetical protein JWQ38_1913 [Flavipsychrobacter sp.]|nr:hypothetical protein [Flavipsychrobacter sp.]